MEPVIIIILAIFLFVFIALSFIGFILVIKDSIKRKGKWGINLESVVCPKCGTKAPKFRKPKSMREALWGGWTCEKDGCKIDKWGQEIK